VEQVKIALAFVKKELGFQHEAFLYFLVLVLGMYKVDILHTCQIKSKIFSNEFSLVINGVSEYITEINMYRTYPPICIFEYSICHGSSLA
jgi:hypothetical protein